MSGYTSDQLVAHATADGQMVPLGQRARITGIQAEGAASSTIVFKSGGAAGTTATVGQVTVTFTYVQANNLSDATAV